VSADPRGPLVTILEIETSAGPTRLTLACGHCVERVNHFSYRIGDKTHCFPCGKEADQLITHARFVRDVIARSLLTLPFASLDRDDPFGEIYRYYGQLMGSATSGKLPSANLIAKLVELIEQDVAIHKQAGNYLKAEIEHNWCEGLQRHYPPWGQTAKETP